VSVVYRAVREGEEFALKVMKEASAGHSLDARLLFRYEAAILARLSHPGLVRIFESGEHEGRPYLVMELIKGESLANRLLRGPLPEDELVALGKTLASALGDIHRHGL